MQPLDHNNPLYIPLLLAFGSTVFTLLGGLFAIRFKDNLHLILSFSAGALLGVAFFDLLPEAIELSAGGADRLFSVTTVLAVGFIIYLILNRTIHTHFRAHDPCNSSHHTGELGAGSLCVHSVMDGVAMGLAFRVNTPVGIVASMAVLAHDFSDGINTVGIILKDNRSNSYARKWLVLDALSPMIGVLLTRLFYLSSGTLGLLLALFAGFFLYIGAVDLLPESHHEHPGFLPICSTIAGMLLIYVVVMIGMRI